MVSRTNATIPGFIGGCAYYVRIVGLNGGGRGKPVTRLLVVGPNGKAVRGEVVCPALRR